MIGDVQSQSAFVRIEARYSDSSLLHNVWPIVHGCVDPTKLLKGLETASNQDASTIRGTKTLDFLSLGHALELCHGGDLLCQIVVRHLHMFLLVNELDHLALLFGAASLAKPPR